MGVSGALFVAGGAVVLDLLISDKLFVNFMVEFLPGPAIFFGIVIGAFSLGLTLLFFAVVPSSLITRLESWGQKWEKRLFDWMWKREKAILDAPPPPAWLFWVPTLRRACLLWYRFLRQARLKRLIERRISSHSRRR